MPVFGGRTTGTNRVQRTSGATQQSPSQGAKYFGSRVYTPGPADEVVVPPDPGGGATVTVGTPTTLTGSVATVVLPSGLEVGDYTFIQCSTVASTGTITCPAGWAELQPVIHGDASTSSNFALYYKKWVPGETSVDITAKTGRLCFIPFALKGADPLNPVDAYAINTAVPDASTTIDSPNLTSTAGTLVLNMPCARTSASNVSLTFVPSPGMTELQQAFWTASGVSGAGGMISYKRIAPGDSTGVLTATVSGGATNGAGDMLLIVKDAPTAPPATTQFAAFGVPL